MAEPATATTPKAGRNLPVAIAVAVVLLAWILGSLLWWQWGFIIFLMVAVVAGSVEINSALNKARMNAVFAPIAVGAPVTIVLAYATALQAGELAGADHGNREGHDKGSRTGGEMDWWAPAVLRRCH